METLLRILAFLIGGGILAYLALLYFGALYATLVPSRDARQIAPITTITDGKSSTDLGPALSQMLLVHLAEIRRRLQEAAHALRPGQGDAPSGNTVVGPVERQSVALLQDELPNRLQESFNIQLNVGGVELTGIANWLFRQFNSTETMRIVIETVGERKHVYGNFDPAGLETFVIQLEKNPPHDVILKAVAHRIAHRSISRSILQIGALRDDEFQDFLTALSRLADLNRQIERGRAPAKEFDDVLALLYPLAGKVPKWVALARITGEVAERASNLPRAKELYAQAAAAEEDARRREDLNKRIARVDEAIKTAGATPRIPPTAVATAAPSAPLPREVVEPLLRQVGVTGGTMPNPVRVAIVGGPPSGVAAGERVKITGPETAESKENDSLSDYFAKMMHMVAVVAPNTDFVFSRRAVARASDLIEAIQDVLPEQPRIILLPIRGIATPPVDQLLKRIAEQNIITVLSAGNEGAGQPVPFAGMPLLDEIVVVSAVDGKGLPADFSQRDPKAFWAPGVNVPAPQPPGFIRWSGTGPASALAAGVLARVLSEKPSISRADLLAKLRQGATPLSTQAGAPPVLNFEKTLKLVAAGKRGKSKAASAAASRDAAEASHQPSSKNGG